MPNTQKNEAKKHTTPITGDELREGLALKLFRELSKKEQCDIIKILHTVSKKPSSEQTSLLNKLLSEKSTTS